MGQNSNDILVSHLKKMSHNAITLSMQQALFFVVLLQTEGK